MAAQRERRTRIRELVSSDPEALSPLTDPVPAGCPVARGFFPQTAVLAGCARDDVLGVEVRTNVPLEAIDIGLESHNRRIGDVYDVVPLFAIPMDGTNGPGSNLEDAETLGAPLGIKRKVWADDDDESEGEDQPLSTRSMPLKGGERGTRGWRKQIGGAESEDEGGGARRDSRARAQQWRVAVVAADDDMAADPALLRDWFNVCGNTRALSAYLRKAGRRGAPLRLRGMTIGPQERDAARNLVSSAHFSWMLQYAVDYAICRCAAAVDCHVAEAARVSETAEMGNGTARLSAAGNERESAAAGMTGSAEQRCAIPASVSARSAATTGASARNSLSSAPEAGRLVVGEDYQQRSANLSDCIPGLDSPKAASLLSYDSDRSGPLVSARDNAVSSRAKSYRRSATLGVTDLHRIISATGSRRLRGNTGSDKERNGSSKERADRDTHGGATNSRDPKRALGKSSSYETGSRSLNNGGVASSCALGKSSSDETGSGVSSRSLNHGGVASSCDPKKVLGKSSSYETGSGVSSRVGRMSLELPHSAVGAGVFQKFTHDGLITSMTPYEDPCTAEDEEKVSLPPLQPSPFLAEIISTSQCSFSSSLSRSQSSLKPPAPSLTVASPSWQPQPSASRLSRSQSSNSVAAVTRVSPSPRLLRSPSSLSARRKATVPVPNQSSNTSPPDAEPYKKDVAVTRHEECGAGRDGAEGAGGAEGAEGAGGAEGAEGAQRRVELSPFTMLKPLLLHPSSPGASGAAVTCGSGGPEGAEAMLRTCTFPPFPSSPPPPPPPTTTPIHRLLRGRSDLLYGSGGGDGSVEQQQHLQQQVRPEPDDPGSGGGTGTFDIQKVVSFPLNVLVVATNTFASGNHLGQGTYGMVYKAKLPSGDVVAVKRAKADRKQDAGKFRKEIELLSRVSHKNLVRLVGYCREGGEQLLVYEYVAGGNLSQNLNPTWRERHSRPPLNWTERLLIAAGTARGLAYLHEEINVPFIHRDVKPSNIMIDRHVVAKIADFGTTKPMTPEELRKLSVTIQGTAGYCDPDYLRTGHSSKRIDVYSLGIVLLELLTGKGPHKVNRPYRFDVKERFDKGGLPAIVDPTMGLYPADELYHVFDLALRCTDIQNPAARPSMSRVVAELEAVLEPETISRFVSSGPPSHGSADFHTAPSGLGPGPGAVGQSRFAGAGKQAGQGGGEGGAGSAAAGSGVAGLAVGGTAGAALAAAINSASPSRADAGGSPLNPDPPNPPNRSQPQPQPSPPSDAPPPLPSKRTPGPLAYKGRAAGAAGTAAGAAEITGGDIRREREYDGSALQAFAGNYGAGLQMQPAPTAAFRGVSAVAGGGAPGAGVTVAGGAGGNAGGISGGSGVAAPLGPSGQGYRAGERYGEGGGGGGGEMGGERYEEVMMDASFDSSGFDRSGVFSYGAMPPA
ncbi:unnamed protein product [Closterium sp. Yama58-4]|nr:unnamed protein product [Closterium sp. Yama58-4]